MAVAMEVAWRAGGGGGGVGELGSSSTPPGVSIQDVEASLKMKNNVGSANKMNKRAWGADAHKLVQLMMNPLQQQQQRQQQLHAGGNLEAKNVADEEEEEEEDEEEEEVTLDLLGPSSPPTKLQKLEEKDEVRELEPRGAELEPRGAELEPRSRDFLELEPADQPLPLPSGWEKCLDLKTGKLYFVNKSTGMTTSPEITNNKLKSSSEAEQEQEEEKEEELIQTPTCPQLALISSKSPLLAFSTGSKQLNIIKTPQGEHHHAKDQEISNSKFALDLNLTASGSTSPSYHQPSPQQQQPQPQPEPQHQHQQEQQQEDQVEQLRPESSSAAVCTMEMVQRALNRAEKAMGKREMQAPRNSHHHHNHHHRHHHHHSAAGGSSSSSSAHVGGAMSEATSSRSPNSTTSSSNSSSTSSRSSAGLFGGSGVATATTATTKGGILDVLKEEQTVDDPLVVTSELGVCGGEESKEDSWEKKVEDGTDESETMASGQSMLVMGACTRCLMYVMLNKCDPKCPRCESQVPLDFTNATHPPASKRQRVELPESASEHAQV